MVKIASGLTRVDTELSQAEAHHASLAAEVRQADIDHALLQSRNVDLNTAKAVLATQLEQSRSAELSFRGKHTVRETTLSGACC